jgi:DNA-binding transcriptional ArsR family regulator
MDVQQRLERLAMHLESLTQQRSKWIDVVQAGWDLGLSPPDAVHLAELLEDKGWVTLREEGGKRQARLNGHGLSEIPKLRRPRWQQWLDAHPLLANAIVSTGISTVVSSVVSAVMTRLLR